MHLPNPQRRHKLHRNFPSILLVPRDQRGYSYDSSSKTRQAPYLSLLRIEDAALIAPYHNLQFKSLPQVLIQNASLEISKVEVLSLYKTITGRKIIPFYTTNDEGFDTIFSGYLKNSKLSKKDAIFIFSVGGGNKTYNVSTNLIEAILIAKKKNAKIFSIVGRKDGYSYKNSDISILINVNDKKLLTPISESMQVVVWHLLVSDKRLQSNKTKW